jgi:hypothetical protein
MMIIYGMFFNEDIFLVFPYHQSIRDNLENLTKPKPPLMSKLRQNFP